MPLYSDRHNTILAEIRKVNLFRILDMGCGDGKLINYLMFNEPQLEITGIDNSEKSLRKASKLIRSERVRLINQSFFNYSPLYKQNDIIILSEVIEHLHVEDVLLLFQIIFEKCCPKFLIITTPNKSYNINFETLYNGLRHSSHIFEITDDDIPILLNYLRNTFLDYTFKHKYCDKDGASHLITAERSGQNEK